MSVEDRGSRSEASQVYEWRVCESVDLRAAMPRYRVLSSVKAGERRNIGGGEEEEKW